jgi:hypothetical protein
MKHIDIGAFIDALRTVVTGEEPTADYDEIHEQCFGANADDALEWGVSQGRSELAEEIAAIFEKHGVAL